MFLLIRIVRSRKAISSLATFIVKLIEGKKLLSKLRKSPARGFSPFYKQRTSSMYMWVTWAKKRGVNRKNVLSNIHMKTSATRYPRGEPMGMPF